MKIETEKIVPMQFLFSIACFIHASSLLSSFFAAITGRDSWLVVLIAFVLSLPILWVYIRLIEDFPGKNLLEMFDLVYGPIAGKIISAIYLWFFLTLASLNLRDLGDFVKQTIMVRTPTVVLFGACAIVCALAIRGGLQVVTRYSATFTVISVFIVILATFFTMGLMKAENFLPMFDLPLKNYVQGTNIVLTIPFGELVVFLMISSNVSGPVKKVKKYLFGGFVLGGLVMLIVVARDTAVLGNIMSFFALPAFETLRMVTLSQALSRMEILFAFILIILLFFKISLLYYISVLSTAQLFKFKSYQPLVLIFGVFITAYAFALYPTTTEHIASGQETVPLIWIPLEFLIPLVTLIVGKIRKFPREEAVQ